MGMNLFQLQKDQPLDLSKLEHITDPDQYDAVVHEAIRNQLKSGGLISPTDGITNFQLEKPDTPSWLGDMMNRVLKDNPDALDDPGSRDTYLQRRFEFISSHEGWRENTYRDSRNLRTVGYGFNLEEPTNRNLFKTSLGKTDEDFDKLRNGETSLSKREGRILFEASAGAAEQKISNTFKDSNLKGYERLALVSLAYNHPALIGPNLTKYVNTGDKEAVLDEIRNRSNLHKSKGISNRRDLEARMFGGMDPDDVEDSNWSLASMLGISSAEASTMKSSDELIEQGRGLNVQQTQVSDRNIPRPKRKPDAPKPAESKGSFLAGLIPSAIRSLVSDVVGVDLETTRNEDYLGEGEKEVLRSMTIQKIQRSGRKSGYMEYKDYDSKYAGVSFSGTGSALYKLLTGDDEYSIKTTLGQFRYEIDDRGHLIITDQYNFNDAKKLQKENPTDADRAANLLQYAGGITDGSVGAYGIVRRGAALWGSKEGEGAKFKIDLGPVSDQRFQVASR